jgi:4-hydroxybenzoate polyprenyltransferase
MVILRKIADHIVFSSIYIACCAVIMVHQANFLLELQYDHVQYYLFVFFSTICSYNFHWLLTTESHMDSIRLEWTNRNRHWHVIYFLLGLVGALVYGFHFLSYWIWLGLGGVLTFLYSAPKIPFAVFQSLRKIAYGKTIFLAGVWTYVTSALPIILGWKYQPEKWLFIGSRFLLIYAICIMFDLRDRESDKKEGLKSLITVLSKRHINYLFLSCLAVYTILLLFLPYSTLIKVLLFIPAGIVLALYEHSKRSYSDYLYYVVLDGLMMLSSLFTLFLSF